MGWLPHIRYGSLFSPPLSISQPKEAGTCGNGGYRLWATSHHSCRVSLQTLAIWFLKWQQYTGTPQHTGRYWLQSKWYLGELWGNPSVVTSQNKNHSSKLDNQDTDVQTSPSVAAAPAAWVLAARWRLTMLDGPLQPAEMSQPGDAALD